MLAAAASCQPGREACSSIARTERSGPLAVAANTTPLRERQDVGSITEKPGAPAGPSGSCLSLSGAPLTEGETPRASIPGTRVGSPSVSGDRFYVITFPTEGWSKKNPGLLYSVVDRVYAHRIISKHGRKQEAAEAECARLNEKHRQEEGHVPVREDKQHVASYQGGTVHDRSR